MPFIYFRILTKSHQVLEDCLLPLCSSSFLHCSMGNSQKAIEHSPFTTFMEPNPTQHFGDYYLQRWSMGFLFRTTSEVLSGVEPIYKLKTSYNKPAMVSKW